MVVFAGAGMIRVAGSRCKNNNHRCNRSMSECVRIPLSHLERLPDRIFALVAQNTTKQFGRVDVRAGCFVASNSLLSPIKYLTVMCVLIKHTATTAANENIFR